MIQVLLILFITVPIIELAVLLKVGSMIGIVPTLGFVILTGIIGVWLIRQQGFLIMLEMRNRIESGEFPGNQIIDGVLIIVSGALLLTPGFITDIIGISILVPDIRMTYRNLLKKWLSKKMGGNV